MVKKASVFFLCCAHVINTLTRGRVKHEVFSVQAVGPKCVKTSQSHTGSYAHFLAHESNTCMQLMPIDRHQ